MQVVEINNLDQLYPHLNGIIELCKVAENETIPAAENMKFSEWWINTSSLLYLLLQEKRFFEPVGCFYVVYDECKIVALSGIYISDFCKDIAIAGVRAYTIKEHRTKYIHGNLIFPSQAEWGRNKKIKMLLLSFNSYNDWLYKFIVRGNKGLGTAFGVKFSDTYKNFFEHNKKVMIKNVPQYILKMSLEDGFTYDFSNIELD